MSDALDQALRALRHRDRSTAEVDRYAPPDPPEAEVDRRLADIRARAGANFDAILVECGIQVEQLRRQGAGNALIRHELAAPGSIPTSSTCARILEPERERAEEIVARRGANPKTARYLTGKGFSYDVVESFIAQSWRETLG
jgi:SOS response regulatory protein OraA/RecX